METVSLGANSVSYLHFELFLLLIVYKMSEKSFYFLSGFLMTKKPVGMEMELMRTVIMSFGQGTS